jgi:hypothetical protein
MEAVVWGVHLGDTLSLETLSLESLGAEYFVLSEFGLDLPGIQVLEFCASSSCERMSTRSLNLYHSVGSFLSPARS